ncbi:Imm50 family immunity protein [Streptomyces sp. CNS654]|uniref:Imm50 family immunity protein n=1 Tax=Streptomyces sp. CNS654 TaxID=1506995 RepID=UPI000515D1B2|nr:Imm50 family immunity protein [Streptomyces sp. CNS654]
MSASDWARLLDDPQSIQSLYEEEPDLNQCDLFHVLADERGDSITLGFQTAHTPVRIRPEWEGKAYNSFTFYLAFSRVEQLTVQGWAAPACKTVSSRRDPGEKLSVAITSDEASLLFRARSVVLSAARVRLVSSSV